MEGAALRGTFLGVGHRRGLLVAVLVLCFVVGAASVASAAQLALPWLIGLSLLAALVVWRFYDVVFGACLVSLTLAQFQGAVFLIMRWAALFMLLLASAYVVRRRRLVANPAAAGLGMLGLYCALTSSLSYYPTVSLLKSFSLLLLAGVALCVAPAVRRLHPDLGAQKYVRRVYLWLALAVVLSNAVFSVAMPSLSLYNGRFRGWFVNPNGIGALYGVFFLPLLESEALKCRRAGLKLGLVFVLLLTVLELAASQSRAGILSGVIATLVLLLGGRRWQTRILLIAMLVAALLTIYLTVPQGNPISQFLYRGEADLTGSGRLLTWKDMWARFLARPLLGAGLGVSDTGTQADGITFASAGYTIEKNNSLLAALEELGMLGFSILVLALIVPIGRACWRGWSQASSRGDRSHLVLIAIVVAGLFNTMFEAWLLSPGSLFCFSFWIFVALLLSESRGGPAHPGHVGRQQGSRQGDAPVQPTALQGWGACAPIPLGASEEG